MPQEPQDALGAPETAQHTLEIYEGGEIASQRVGNESPVGLATAAGLTPVPIAGADYLEQILSGDVTTTDQLIFYAVILLSTLGTAWLRQWRARGRAAA